MKLTNYLILTQIFEEYGKHRYLEGMFMAAGQAQNKQEQKIKAEDAWQRAFAIIKEMEGAND